MNYTLTPYEFELVTNPQVLLSKNIIIKKVYEMFGSLSETYQRQTLKGIPTTITNPKISRGENYIGLPYVMLDYPRLFGKPDVFAIRTFFWWGNFFSITLQLAGAYQQRFSAQVQHAINEGLLNGWFITSSNNAWDHQFDDNYYKPIINTNDYCLRELPFIKVAIKISLSKWEEAEDFLNKNYTLLVNIFKEK